MRLPADAGNRLRTPLIGIVLTLGLAGCGVLAGSDRVATIGDRLAAVATGPAADYPMVLGDPFTVDGEVFTPSDTLNYDTVGYAGLDEGVGITIAHRTLPLPSYAEVTSLDTGKTILARVERRGPMTGTNLLSLSAAAAAQLGVHERAPVRVRRVNPPEIERAELRAGRTAPERLETPRSLVEVLRRKLPANGAAALRVSSPAAVAAHPSAIAVSGTPGAATTHSLPSQSVRVPAPRGVVEVPTKSTLARAPMPAPGVASAKPPSSAEAPTGMFVVQAGTFANRANAQALASKLGGQVSPSGTLFRVRTGPFVTRGQAEAALAKVRAAGYRDARVYTAG